VAAGYSRARLPIFGKAIADDTEKAQGHRGGKHRGGVMATVRMLSVCKP
jgi:hypothetical protein